MTLCVSCRRALITTLRGSYVRASPFRTAATVPPTSNAAPANPPPPTAQQSTPAISSATPAASQPFSTPNISPQNTLKAAAADLKKPAGNVKLQSSIPGGTELKGLNYIKGAPPLLAKEDDEYPEWLWTLLTPKSSAMDGQLGKGDLAGSSLPSCPAPMIITANTPPPRNDQEAAYKILQAAGKAAQVHAEADPAARAVDRSHVRGCQRHREFA